MHLPRSAATLALVLATGAARAALGGHATDVPADATRLQARAFSAQTRAGTATGAAFTRHQITLPAGGSAVEFVDASGNVFAVSWAAPIMPDLSVLLGSYKASLDTAQQAPHTLRSPRLLQADDGDWVLVSTGHLRAYSGYSYLRSRLPAGFDLQELAQ
ncbi:DUF2844 domain-containing protein [Polaromonas sp. C04]|mgnify:CR=1 FL=1|uniref:DUF2844 domain-containing protein n=1 Tax=Polaromonas sp. C04 TaxID=1945857 RepID=UPI0009D5EBF8|nr:DUF2844 domain-containing protein [Polaromonas sp. C04]OOG54825.1 hypothetical protein B0E49_08860 [Polaromonas sp. C04]